MFEIVEARYLAPDVKRFRIRAPLIAKYRKPGQFVIVRVHEAGERIPLTIASSDAADGTITLIVQGIGKTTKHLNTLEAGAAVHDVVGPLGRPGDIRKVGTVVVIGGGVGAAIAYPTAVAHHDIGNRVVTILGGRTRDLVILEDEMRAVSDEMIVTTDDGSYGRKGLVIDPLNERLAEGWRPDLVMCVGPIPMMRAVAEATRPYGIETIASLNPIMVDGTGMCGGCRASVGGKTVFVCVDGPEFDAHQVDFGLLALRNRTYLMQEREALARFEKEGEGGAHRCALEGTQEGS
jgi:ferredoxin--NADP+ reductase